MPHSHDDVGWLKTVDEYFDGGEQRTQNANVGVELDTIMNCLEDDPKRKFSEVEMKFFKMWWDQQDDTVRAKVHKFIKNGQLELINAGWSMHDEACPTYEDMINNHIIGHQWILDEFGVKPRIGWQIDPFGHSNTNARFFTEMGFDAWFFARLDYVDKDKRMNNGEMEFVWRPNADSFGTDTQILTHVLYNHYSSPDKFGWDLQEGSDNWINNLKSKDFNADTESAWFVDHLTERAKHYLTDDIFVLFGGDFQY